MRVRSVREIYLEIEAALKNTNRPMTCTEVYDSRTDIRGHADLQKQNDGPMSAEERRRAEIDRLSDYMGHMWRRGVLTRHTAGDNAVGKARFAYTMKIGVRSDPVELPDPTKPSVAEKRKVDVSQADDGTITIDMDTVTLTIKLK